MTHTERNKICQMTRAAVCLLLALVCAATCIAQPADPIGASGDATTDCPLGIQGAWTSTLETSALYPVTIAVARNGDAWAATFKWSQGATVAGGWPIGDRVRFQSAALPLMVEVRPSDPSAPMDGFVTHGRWMTHRRWVPADGGWTTSWSPLFVDPDGSRLDLYIDAEGGYFFFRDPRLPSLYGLGVACNRGEIQIQEGNLGLTLTGRLDEAEDRLDLEVSAATGKVPITFRRMAQDEIPDDPSAPDTPPIADGRIGHGRSTPGTMDDGWVTSGLSDEGFSERPLDDLVEAVAQGGYPNTHAILVARSGRIVFEEYFHGYDCAMPHDTRSAAKSLASLFVGAAIGEGKIKSVETPALSFFPDYRLYANWDERKARITIRDLLRMASGLDANDSNSGSQGSEAAYQSQHARPDWIKLVLDTPMIDDPGAQSLYGGGNPLVIGGVLHAAVGEPVEWFAHRTLFAPLGIHGYPFLITPNGIPYLGGGYHLAPRHLAAIGQLVLQRGTWNGRRLLDSAWIEESTAGHGRLAPLDRNGHPYGYLWWRHTYRVGERMIETIEARGNGGQYLFIAPELDLVAVVNSGNYRGGLEMTRQPEQIFRDHVLPAALGH